MAELAQATEPTEFSAFFRGELQPGTAEHDKALVDLATANGDGVMNVPEGSISQLPDDRWRFTDFTSIASAEMAEQVSTNPNSCNNAGINYYPGTATEEDSDENGEYALLGIGTGSLLNLDGGRRYIDTDHVPMRKFVFDSLRDPNAPTQEAAWEPFTQAIEQRIDTIVGAAAQELLDSGDLDVLNTLTLPIGHALADVSLGGLPGNSGLPDPARLNKASAEVFGIKPLEPGERDAEDGGLPGILGQALLYHVEQLSQGRGLPEYGLIPNIARLLVDESGEINLGGFYSLLETSRSETSEEIEPNSAFAAVNLALNLAIGASDAPSQGLNMSIWGLLANPEQKDKLVDAHNKRADNFDMLDSRLQALGDLTNTLYPASGVMARVVIPEPGANTAEIGGHEFRRGQRLVMNLAAANRDPNHEGRHHEPHAFDLDRQDIENNFAFGAGSPHHCLGMFAAKHAFGYTHRRLLELGVTQRLRSIERFVVTPNPHVTQISKFSVAAA